MAFRTTQKYKLPGSGSFVSHEKQLKAKSNLIEAYIYIHKPLLNLTLLRKASQDYSKRPGKGFQSELFALSRKRNNISGTELFRIIPLLL